MTKREIVDIIGESNGMKPQKCQKAWKILQYPGVSMPFFGGLGMRGNKLNKMVLTGLFIALGLILPFFTGQIPQIGKMLLPMHIPVLICGFVCGWQYGLLSGFIVPLLRCALFSMPGPVNAFCMAFEMAGYGALCGLLYARLGRGVISLYVSLIGAMIGGRVIWGIVSLIVLGINGSGFGWQAFLAGALLNAIPGIILQLVLIPALVAGLARAGAMERTA